MRSADAVGHMVVAISFEIFSFEKIICGRTSLQKNGLLEKDQLTASVAENEKHK
jgi:hypothetical protein